MPRRERACSVGDLGWEGTLTISKLSISDLWDNIKKFNICLSPRQKGLEQDRGEQKKIFEKIRATFLQIR